MSWKTTIITGMLAGVLAAPASLANPTPPEDEEIARHQMVVVTGSAIRVTQGGAQDITFFRDTVADGSMPAPGAITSEGLLSEHDLLLASTGSCDQLFCLNTESMNADFISFPETDYLLGLGFDTNLTYETWSRDPMTIIAVVDNSGSMNGLPLDIARESMREVLAHLRPGDRMGVIKYGATTEVVMPVSDVTEARDDIIRAIDSIHSNGSTYMEAGLQLGFETAREAQHGFDGTTRVVLFTDEQPNVGDTDAGSFIAMARDAADEGIGLTTIGVADHFGAELANQIASAQGGNLFYIPSRDAIETTLGKDFDLLVTELAHNLHIRIEPARGLRIDRVFGVPGEALDYHSSGAVSLEVPSIFLSSNGGGIFLALSGTPRNADELADISMSYIATATGAREEDHLIASGPVSTPSEGLQLASMLVDEFGLLQSAAETTMFGMDASGVIEQVSQFNARITASGLTLPEQEVELLADVMYTMQRNGPRFTHDESYVEAPELNGAWRITSIRDRRYSPTGRVSINFDRGDLIALDLMEDMFNARRFAPDRGDPDFEVESLWVDTRERQITLYDSDLVFNYRVSGDRLYLTPEGTDLRITLERMNTFEMTGL